MLGGGDTFVFNNPFHVAPATTTIVHADYSQPIPAPQQLEDGEEAPPMDEATEEAIALFDKGREAFRAGDYKKALELADQSIERLPTDATLHEFRALALFAMKEFQQAAATIYAVLATGPGWNWETVSSLYANTETFTAQLRALEDYTRANPKDAAPAFLLAYHYLVMGHTNEAVKMLERVKQLLPDDPLVGQLLDAFRQDAPAAFTKPVPE
jgi:tetratricopeptide (TPR) repeat protein